MKKILVTLLCVTAINAHANINSIAHLFPINAVEPKNVDVTFSSLHKISMNNSSGNNQTVHVCYRIISCGTFPAWKRSAETCMDHVIAPGTGLQEEKGLILTVNYPFNGATCTLDAKTDITGDMEHSSADQNTFIIK